MAAYATLSSKFQITIPAAARRQLGLEAGRGLEVRVKEDRIELVPQPSVRDLVGLVKDMPTDVPRERDRV